MALFDMGQIGSQVGNFVQSDVGGNMLSDLGHGLLTGSNWKQGLSNAGQRAVQLAPMRQEQATKNQQANSTQAWLQAQRPDLLPLLEAGATPAEVLSMALSEQQAQKQEQAETQRREALAQYITDPAARAAYIGGEVDWEGAKTFGQGSIDAPQIEARFNPETGQEEKVQWDPQAGWVPFGGPKQVSARDNPMNATIQQAILGADEVATSSENSIATLDRALELSQQAYEGPFSEQRAAGAALFGDEGAKATLELKNIVMSNALESLKSTFGAAPTEGERKILLEIQGSVDQPKAVREAIYRRAQAAAKRRIDFNRERAGALRSGEYFDEGYGQQAPASGGVDDILSGYGL